MALDQVMHERLVIVEPFDSLRYLATLFDSRETHHILVMENGVLLGIISDRDLLKSIHPNTFTDIASNTELNVLNKTANQIMTPKPICINRDKSIVEAGEVMLDKSISALPVVNDLNEVLGLVSLKGIVGYFVRRTRERQKKMVSLV